MKLANLDVMGSSHLGVVEGSELWDLTAATNENSPGLPASVEQALVNWEMASSAINEALKSMKTGKGTKFGSDLGKSRILPPVRNPSKILCVFVNYRSHGKEVGTPPSEPVFFFKHSNSIVGNGDEVVVPRFSSKADHEVELGLVIGKKGKDIEASAAYDHVAGYTVLNDISFRDGMKRGVEGTVLGRNLYRGKVADTALPMGPWLVTSDELQDPYPLRISLKVNDEVRQEGTTDDMIFRIPELIASASEANTLLPGDVIATGTCSGVGLYTGKYLNDGDMMEAEVEKIGVLRNRVRIQGKS